jgi:hypothetical protein
MNEKEYSTGFLAKRRVFGIAFCILLVTSVDESTVSPNKVSLSSLILVDKDGNEVTRSGGVTTPEGISSQDVTFASPGSFNVRVEKIKDTNEMVQSGLTVVPEFPVGIASIVTTVAIAGIIMVAKRVSFLQMSKMY